MSSAETARSITTRVMSRMMPVRSAAGMNWGRHDDAAVAPAPAGQHLEALDLARHRRHRGLEHHEHGILGRRAAERGLDGQALARLVLQHLVEKALRLRALALASKQREVGLADEIVGTGMAPAHASPALMVMR